MYDLILVYILLIVLCFFCIIRFVDFWEMYLRNFNYRRNVMNESCGGLWEWWFVLYILVKLVFFLFGL